jgi:CHAD domain-containing protein
MDFKIIHNEPINREIKRIAIELLDDSISRLGVVQTSFDVSIHETRKNFKKMRGLLRLVRNELGEDIFKKENILFRDTGRILSPIRDAAVMVESLNLIKKNYSNEIKQNEYDLLKKNLSVRARRVRSQFKKNKELIEAVINILENHKSDIIKLPLRKKTFTQLIPSINLVYERGLNAMQTAVRYPSASNFHEWRKRAKYLWYQTRILEDAWPEYMTLLAAKLSQLSDVLGLEHDLAELRNLLMKESTLCTNKEFQTKLSNYIGQERLKLQSDAKSLSPFIYSETPENFSGRLQAYWTH